MNAIQKLVESILVKMGFVGAVVENIYLDSKPFRHIRFVADIPVISFLPHLVNILRVQTIFTVVTMICILFSFIFPKRLH